ncbi:hypothetical protein A2803_02630 [Candidatus Woesebacteria bacterium RIFCSPHIGHO2_01_FULL_44_21]|uniref:NTP pyrophosphohydrolase MazG putative catalytic core domain-containing protein n=1 Tax=Candidatus Woesebacteria bacterium RIFCSPHIGHO2_01_FULL_44_21 TaxID=1802503 RepID=A0A1F7YXJ7_9BACT|nr:MAG: hypothetical protein A2803_02630 [Candidatus Woesebacteria bacterium RIFCSPHIGHO2_01_FULL_44_21]OGM69832.1 MAG: hypothetical protein A2897_00615 [Candidatus Woesebacteria bacterium RIFCSPLOWO2_01_FULL_44_24b]
MRKFKFEKLVRDKIVDAIIANGNHPNWKTLSDKEYIDELKKKIIEEASELINSEGEELLKELVDIQEIIDNLLLALQVSKEKLLEVQNKKNQERGSFKKRQYIGTVEVKDDAPEIKSYLEHPDKYPEVK